jgi:hypothetical protein
VASLYFVWVFSGFLSQGQKWGKVAACLGFKGGRCREDESLSFLPFGWLQGRKVFRFRVFLLLAALSPVKIFFPPASQFFLPPEFFTVA